MEGQAAGVITAPAALPAYCERTGPGPWAEPLDAVSNLAFLVAAAVALRAWRRAGSRDGPLLLLVADVAAIGLGSLAFHVAPGPLTWAADVWPIRLYVLGHLALALRRLGGAGGLATLGSLIALAVATTAATRAWPEALAGGVGYLPVLAALALLGGWLAWRPGPPQRREAGRAHLAAAAIFAVALAFRTVDGPPAPPSRPAPTSSGTCSPGSPWRGCCSRWSGRRRRPARR